MGVGFESRVITGHNYWCRHVGSIQTPRLGGNAMG